MSYSALIAWIEAHFPGADYNVQVALERKSALGLRRATWAVYVWTAHRTIRADGHTADQVAAILEATLGPPERIRLDLIDPDRVSA